jgi:hypothetical protein
MGEYKQTSFSGGLNLLLDDTRLPVSFKYKEGDTPYDITYNQYRIGLNIRTRFDVAQPILKSAEDVTAPKGLKQGITTFGNYIIIFVAGNAYYRLNTSSSWTQITNFSMNSSAPRYWFVAVPLATTNYGRLATALSGTPTVPQANLPVSQVNQVAGAFANLPGLLVQDNITQPQFIYIDSNNTVQCRTTQTYSQWSYDPTGVNDKREYVPIGSFMEWYNGILFIVAQDAVNIYRSVSGRPLDFVINVDLNGNAGGDATTTSYSVGVGGITAMRAMPGNMLLVAAGNSAMFSVTLNTTPNAPTIFGEYTFIRTFLFTSNCVSERGIIDISGTPASPSSGDSVFIDANGLRSFNAIEYQQNEGRNSVFSATVASLFSGVQQQPLLSSAIAFDNYAIFSVNTVFGYVLIVYDTINGVYQSLDTTQLGNHAAKQMASITVATLALYAITDDDRVVQLYIAAPEAGTIRLGAVCSQDPKKELKVINFRAIMANITEDISVTATLFVNNRLDSSQTQNISYVPAPNTYSGVAIGSDIGTQTNSLYFSFPNSAQGWKAFIVLTWTGGAVLNSTSITTQDITPMQPLQTQAVIQQS